MGSNEIELLKISNPAKRAFASKSISTLKQLSKFTKKEVLKLHGVGPGAIPVLEKALKEKDLKFLKD